MAEHTRICVRSGIYPLHNTAIVFYYNTFAARCRATPLENGSVVFLGIAGHLEGLSKPYYPYSTIPTIPYLYLCSI